MRQFTLGIGLGLIAGFAVGHLLVPVLMHRSHRSHRDDALRGIAALHRVDSIATVANSADALLPIWTADAVRFQDGSPIDVGRAAIHSADSAAMAANPQARVASYSSRIRDVQVMGDRAVEWGEFTGTYVEKPGAALHPIAGRVLRVLRREPDGHWRFTHVMWNVGHDSTAAH